MASAAKRWFPLLALLLWSCQAGAPLSSILESNPEPTPTQPVFRIGVSPSLYTWAERQLATFSEQEDDWSGELRIILQPAKTGWPALQASETVMFITSERSDQGFFQTPLGQEAIAVVISTKNPIRSFSSSDLQKLFSGSISDWDSLGWEGTVQPIIPLPGDELRTSFQFRVMGDRQFSTASYLAPSPDVVATLLAKFPNAIGFVPFSSLPATVRVARIDSALPGEGSFQSGRYPLLLNIIGSSIGEPSGVVRDWIAWMQSSLTD